MSEHDVRGSDLRGGSDLIDFPDRVQQVIDGLPSSSLLDRAVVVDALLDLFGAPGEHGERVTTALRDLPPAGLMARSVATGTLLGLLDPSTN